MKAELKAVEEELARGGARARRCPGSRCRTRPRTPRPTATAKRTHASSAASGDPAPGEESREATEIGRFEMERAARLSGSRFGYMVGDTALLALALYRFAVDHVARSGFTPVIPPVLVREEAMIGTGFFPTERSNIYALEADDLYLTGTSEVALAGLHMGEILETDDLPLRYRGFSTCFRREAGAAGKDTRGMFRVHQFNKVEMFVVHAAGRLARRARADGRARGGASPGARPAVPRRRRRRRRPRRSRGAEDRPRGVVPVAGPLPRGHVVLEYDRLPGAPTGHTLAVAGGPRAAPHAERHRRRRTAWCSRSSRTSRARCPTRSAPSAHLAEWPAESPTTSRWRGRRGPTTTWACGLRQWCASGGRGRSFSRFERRSR